MNIELIIFIFIILYGYGLWNYSEIGFKNEKRKE